MKIVQFACTMQISLSIDGTVWLLILNSEITLYHYYISIVFVVVYSNYYVTSHVTVTKLLTNY